MHEHAEDLKCPSAYGDPRMNNLKVSKMKRASRRQNHNAKIKGKRQNG